jgi:DNA-binding response OmpR family regulator
MKRPCILLLEGSDLLRKHTAEALQSYRVVPVATQIEADHAVRHQSFDALVMDLSIDREDPAPVLGMIANWRASGEVSPVVCVSFTLTPDLIVASLQAGADHVARKPYQYRVLTAQLDRLIGRHHEFMRLKQGSQPEADAIRKAGGVYLSAGSFTFGGATIDSHLHINFKTGEPRRARLNPKKVRILQYFAQHRGQLVTRDELLRSVWGPHSNTGRTSLPIYLSKLRTIYRLHGEDFDRLVRNRARVGWDIAPVEP